METSTNEKIKEAGVAKEDYVMEVPHANKIVLRAANEALVAKGATIGDNILSLVQSEIKGAGNVDIVSVEVHFTPSNHGQKMACVIVGAHADYEMFYWTQLGGYYEVSNPKNYGETRKVILTMSDLTSKQIQPQSAKAPAPKFKLFADPGVFFSVKFALRVNTLLISTVDFQ